MDRKTIEGLLAEGRDIKSELEDIPGPIATDVKELSQVMNRISFLLSIEGEPSYAMIQKQVQKFIDVVEALSAKRFALTQLVDDARDIGRDLVRISHEHVEQSEDLVSTDLHEDTADATDTTDADNTSFKSRRKHKTREVSAVSAYEDAYVNGEEIFEDRKRRGSVRERLEHAANALERMNPSETEDGSLGWDLTPEHPSETESVGWDLNSEPEKK